MAKFKKALALVLSLAMVLTLAPIASVNSQAAAKYKISAKTTAIAAGKTYNVKVTGVKKKPRLSPFLIVAPVAPDHHRLLSKQNNHLYLAKASRYRWFCFFLNI